MKPKITFIPFSEDYSIILPDYSQLITPKFIHVNWEEDKEGKVYEIAHQQLSFLGIEVVIPEIVHNGPFDLEWAHKGKTYTEGLWNQTHIKEPDKYRLGDGTICMSEKIVSKDQIEKFRLCGKRWSLKRIDYMSWGDSAKYRNAIDYKGPNSGTLLLIW